MLKSRIQPGPLILFVLGIGVQTLTYCITPIGPLSYISGLLGVSSVVLCSAGNRLTFLFGFAQIGTYSVLCWQQRFYAGIALNIFYFVTQLYGIWLWSKRMHEAGCASSEPVPTRTLSVRLKLILGLAVAVLTLICGAVLGRYTSDSQPWLDALTTVPAIAAQILMVLAYRDQWVIWLLVDILSATMWGVAGDYCMMAQYMFWCANCVMGYILWSKSLKNDKNYAIKD